MKRSDPDILGRVLVRSAAASLSNARVAAYAAGSLLGGRVGVFFERRLSRQLAAGLRARKLKGVHAHRQEFFH